MERNHLVKTIHLDLQECGCFDLKLDEQGGGTCISSLHYISGFPASSLHYIPGFPDIIEEVFENDKYEAMIDAVESLVLSHAIEGVDICSEPYKNGLKTTLNAIGNQ